MNIFAIILLIAVIAASILLCIKHEEKETEKIYELFQKGAILRHYEVTGHAFKNEKLICEEVVLDRKGKYVLLQCGKNSPYEDNINLIVEYSDKVELIWDGKVIATFGCNC